MVLSGRWCCLRSSKPRVKRGRVILWVTDFNSIRIKKYVTNHKVVNYQQSKAVREFIDAPFTSRLYGDVPDAIRLVYPHEECKTCSRFTSCPFECYIDCLESRVNYWFSPTLFNFDREQGRVID